MTTTSRKFKKEVRDIIKKACERHCDGKKKVRLKVKQFNNVMKWIYEMGLSTTLLKQT